MAYYNEYLKKYIKKPESNFFTLDASPDYEN